MRRSLLLLAAAFVLVLGLGLRTLAVAQESSPTAEEEETVCPEAMGTPEASPEGMEMETPMAMETETPATMEEESPSASPSAEEEEGCHVDIEDTAFKPANIEIAVGTTVTWENYDDASQTGPHTVTADDGSFDSGNLEQGDTFSHTFDTAGEFAYHCENHPNMMGTVIVR